jgi:hypothetical protein
MAAGDDPAFNVVKTLVVEFSIDDLPVTANGTDPETIILANPGITQRVADLRRDLDGHLILEAWKNGRYDLQTSTGPSQIEVSHIPAPVEFSGPWALTFPPGWGAPAKLSLDKLTSWSEHSDPGVKYFSGTATYITDASLPTELFARGRRLYLDLGKVEVMAQAKLNGSDLGLLWKPPFVVDVTETAKAGTNVLEVKVVNLWINRMIGDEQMPEDSLRNSNGTLKQWPEWLTEGKGSPTGRYTFTSWRLWKKGDALVPSGLLGPVRILAKEQVRVP